LEKHDTTALKVLPILRLRDFLRCCNAEHSSN
jgi:hypothetical protein